MSRTRTQERQRRRRASRTHDANEATPLRDENAAQGALSRLHAFLRFDDPATTLRERVNELAGRVAYVRLGESSVWLAFSGTSWAEVPQVDIAGALPREIRTELEHVLDMTAEFAKAEAYSFVVYKSGRTVCVPASARERFADGLRRRGVPVVPFAPGGQA